ncbi:MAG: hypothetical protein V8T10_10690 [Merdibacter sp.]
MKQIIANLSAALTFVLITLSTGGAAGLSNRLFSSIIDTEHVADSGLPADLSDRGAAVEHRGGIQGQSVALSSSGAAEGLFLILTICLWHHRKKTRSR